MAFTDVFDNINGVAQRKNTRYVTRYQHYIKEP